MRGVNGSSRRGPSDALVRRGSLTMRGMRSRACVALVVALAAAARRGCANAARHARDRECSRRHRRLDQARG
jgi:hypothetical protein